MAPNAARAQREGSDGASSRPLEEQAASSSGSNAASTEFQLFDLEDDWDGSFASQRRHSDASRTRASTLESERGRSAVASDAGNQVARPPPVLGMRDGSFAPRRGSSSVGLNERSGESAVPNGKDEWRQHTLSGHSGTNVLRHRLGSGARLASPSDAAVPSGDWSEEQIVVDGALNGDDHDMDGGRKAMDDGRSGPVVGRSLSSCCRWEAWSDAAHATVEWFADVTRSVARHTRDFLVANWIVLVALVLCGVGLAFLGVYAFQPLSWKGWFTFAVLLIVLAAIVAGWLPTHYVFIVADVMLMAFFVTTPSEGLSGFSNPGVVSVAVLFMVSEGIQRTSALRWIFRQLLGRPKSLFVAQLRSCIPVAVLSVFLHKTATMVIMIPTVQRWAHLNGLSSSKLLMPMNDAALVGSTVTIIGSSSNLVLIGLTQQANVTNPKTGQSVNLSIYGIGQVAIFNWLACLLVLFAVSRLLLTDRENVVEDLVAKPREYSVAVAVLPSSPIVGLTIQQAGLRSLKGLFLFELTRDNGALIAAPGPDTIIQADDIMLFAGRVETVTELYMIEGVVPASAQTRKLSVQMHRRRLYEVVVSPFSSLRGKTVRETNFRKRYRGAIIAVHRGGAIVRDKIGDIEIRGGETFIVEAGDDFGEQYARDSDFSLVSEISGSYRPRDDLPHMIIAGVLVAAMVGIAASALMSIVVSASLAALGMIITGCMTARQAGESVKIPIMLTIAAAFGVGKAMEVSGAAAQLARFVVNVLGNLGTIGLLFGIYIISALLANVITSVAAVSIMFSVVASPSSGIIYRANLNPFAALYVMAIAANCTFLLHIGQDTNLMVHGAANYRVIDWIKLGVPLQIASGIVTVLVAYWFFR